MIHLRTPSAAQAYDRANPLRIETAEDTARVDERIALDLVRARLPSCCRAHAGTTTAERSTLGESDMKESAMATYTCPMHPEVRQDKPGKCPTCGMALVEKK